MKTLAILLVLVPSSAWAAPINSVPDAVVALDDWQLEDVKAAAEAFLAEDPKNPEVLYLAGRVQHARGEHVSALSLMQAAEQGGVEAAAQFKPLVEGPARYLGQFRTLETPHFKIRYVGKDEVVAYYARDVLESAYKNIGADLDFLAAERGEKIVVEIYPNAAGLASATGLTIQEIQTSGTIAVCKFHRLMITSPLALWGGYEWADTLAHEFVHLVVSKKSRNTIPIWLHEGIAKYFESRWRGPAGLALSPYSEKLLADAVRTKKFITYQQMHPSMAKLPSQESAALAFAEVFTTIEFLTKTYGPKKVPEVLALTATGMELEPALKKVYGMGLGGIESAWKKYLATRPFREVPGAQPKKLVLVEGEKQAKEDAPLKTATNPEVEKFQRLAEKLEHQKHFKAAAIEYEKAYAKAGEARHEGLDYRLARMYADTGQDEKALSICDKSLTANPEHADCHLLAGRVRMLRKEFQAAQKHFEAMRYVNPYNPDIHRALASLYEEQGKTKDADAERQFIALTEEPAKSRKYELPAPRTGNAKVNVIALPFGDVRVNGAKVAAPFWGYAVDAGELSVQGSAGESKSSIGAGETKDVVVR